VHRVRNFLKPVVPQQLQNMQRDGEDRPPSSLIFLLNGWLASCFVPRMGDKRVVYIIGSDVDPDRHYLGITSEVERRLRWHDSGPSGVTLHNRPWSLVVTLEFAHAKLAGRFERYLRPALDGPLEAALRARHTTAGSGIDRPVVHPPMNTSSSSRWLQDTSGC
jgi:putative endonuclease